MHSRQLIPYLCICLLVLTAGCVHVNVGWPEGAQGPKAQGGPKKDKAKDPFKPWDEVLEDSKQIDGYLTTHLKRDQTLYLELPESMLDQDLGLLIHYSRGIGVFNVHDGLPLSGTQMLRFKRMGDKVYLERRNPLFTAEAGSPMAMSLEDNVGHSLVAGFEIKSQKQACDCDCDHAEPDEDSGAACDADSHTRHTGKLLIDLGEFLISDYPNIAERLKYYHDKKPVKLDSKLSFVSKVQGFPRNTEIDVALSYSPAKPADDDSEGVSDPRSIPVGVRYSFFALPEQPMLPRLADDRLGYFLTVHRDFSRDMEKTPYVRYAERWRLEKADHSLELSDPVEPIVYWIDRSVPLKYRKYVAEGIETWQLAFEQAGIKNAIVAKVAPSPEEDPGWSAEDIRYSTVRWTAAHRMGYAIGPSQNDPRTGEILNADVLISSTFVTSWLYHWQDYAGPDGLSGALEELRQLEQALPSELRGRTCLAEMGKSHELAMQHTLLTGLGELDGSEPLPEDYLGPAIRDLVLHEVGHTLGLRHNFKSSAGVPVDKLHDVEWTKRNGLSLSVMDYNPVNVALDRSKQGLYWTINPGSYDHWVIKYGYAPVYEQDARGPFAMKGTPVSSSEAELVGLSKLARQSTDPLHVYGTDEDNWLGPFAIDPLTNAWDLGADPLSYLDTRLKLVSMVQPRLERRLIEEGESYDRLRSAVSRFIGDRRTVSMTASKMIGGIYASRAHKGDPNAPLPMQPLAAGEQRRAAQVIARAVFSPDAFDYDAELLNKLTRPRWNHWGVISDPSDVVPLDYPLHEAVADVQTDVMRELYQPARLRRVINNELRSGRDPYRLSELFDTVTSAVWQELGDDGSRPAAIGSLRRNLQRAHLDTLSALLLDTKGAVPEDARSLARYDLGRVATRVAAALDSGQLGDVTTRAHLEESRARIRQVLDASISLTLPLSK